MSEISNKERYAWVDFAKGLCILGVVTFYVAYFFKHNFGSSGWMDYWVDFARPFRMPDFFMLSGLFLSRVINRPWAEYLEKKVLHYLYFFVLWTGILYLSIKVLGLFHLIDISGIKRQEESILNWLVEPYGMLWFIHILAIFFIVTRLTKNIPSWIVFLIALFLHTFPLWSFGGTVGNFCERFVFFFSGYIFAEGIFKFARWAENNKLRAVYAIVCWAIVNETFVLITRADSKGVSFILGVAGTAAIVALGAIASKSSGTRWLQYLGRNSIVTYLGFYLPVILLVSAHKQYLGVSYLGLSAAIISFLAILIPNIIFVAIRDSAFSFLFVRPKWIKLPKLQIEFPTYFLRNAIRKFNSFL